MKMPLLLLILACLMPGLRGTACADDLSIATVNTEQLLGQYAPWQEELAKQKAERTAFEERRRREQDAESRYRPAVAEWEELDRKSKDQSLTKQERRKGEETKMAAADAIKEMEKLIPRRHGRDWGTPEQMFEERMMRRRRAILREVEEIIDATSVRDNPTLVLEYSRPVDGRLGSSLLWANPEKFPDLTPVILTELNRRNALRLLRVEIDAAEEFSIGPAGESAVISSAETALRELLKAPDAAEQCRILLRDGKPAGRLYAFLGLHLLGAKDLDLDTVNIRRDRNTIRVRKGRTETAHYVREVAAWIDAGKYK